MTKTSKLPKRVMAAFLLLPLAITSNNNHSPTPKEVAAVRGRCVAQAEENQLAWVLH